MSEAVFREAIEEAGVKGILDITDAVVAARILNATLVIPRLDEISFWKDSRFVSGNVHILSHFAAILARKCTPRCYKNHVLPVLLKKFFAVTQVELDRAKQQLSLLSR